MFIVICVHQSVSITCKQTKGLGVSVFVLFSCCSFSFCVGSLFCDRVSSCVFWGAPATGLGRKSHYVLQRGRWSATHIVSCARSQELLSTCCLAACFFGCAKEDARICWWAGMGQLANSMTSSETPSKSMQICKKNFSQLSW